MRTHTGEKPYSCNECGSKFTSSSSLTCHRRIHTGEKPYECPVCGKKFARTHISSHLRSHTGERPFACCACPRAFSSASRLRDHCLVHTGEKPFECAICSEKFRRKNYLAKHLRTHKTNKNTDSTKNQDIVILQQQVPFLVDANAIFTKNNGNEVTLETNMTCDNGNENITLEVSEEIPIEVSGELILHEDDENKELVVVDNGQSVSYTNANICVNTNNVNLVQVNEEVNISSSATTAEKATMKLYKVDQSLVQIQTSTGQVTFRKITSKMTANL